MFTIVPHRSVWRRRAVACAAGAVAGCGGTAPPGVAPVADRRPLDSVVGVRPGDLAPAFDVPGLDGRRVRLADFRGRPVLLDFWATWCEPCRAEMDDLRDVRRRFGDRVVIVGLAEDPTPDTPRAYAAAHGLTWRQAFLGPEPNPTDDRYDVRGLPSIWLVGADGRIVAKGLRGDRIAAGVAAVLGGDRLPVRR